MPKSTASQREILSDTLATLVLYNTSLNNSITFQSLGKALEKAQIMADILVYDNSAVAQSLPSSASWNIKYVHNPLNPGVSKAYNAGFEIARQKGKKWLWLLDQDTEYSSTAIDNYFEAIMQNPDQEIFIPQLHDSGGMVSPFRFQFGGGQRISLPAGVHSLHNFFFHNCGILVSLKSFESAGGYDERFSLDFSDVIFVNRLKKHIGSFVLTAASGKHDLASTSIGNVHDRIIRFKSYVKACQIAAKEYSIDGFISFRLILRALKLCWHYKTFKFIGIYLNP